MVATFDGSGDLLRPTTPTGSGLVSQVSADGTAAYYDFNNIGSTVGITGSSGSYVNKYAYLPFGQTITLAAERVESVPVRWTIRACRITGRVLCVHAEYAGMSPAIGQFVQRDPLELRLEMRISVDTWQQPCIRHIDRSDWSL